MAFDISKCAGCPLAGCGRPAELVGNPKAPYMVVTDVPTTFAAAKGRLMSERASSILSEELSKHGFRRDDFLFVPQVRCAHEADSYTTKEKTLIRKTCRGHFLDAVSEFKPEVILPLGATPATQVVGRSVQITKVRGVPSHSEEHDCMLLALLHPGQVAMYPQHHPVFAADVASFRRLVDSGYDVEASSNAMMGDYKIVDDLEFLIEQQPSIVCIDTEDTSLEYFKKGTFNVRDYDEAIHGKQEPDAAVLTIQLCIKPGEAYMVVWDHPERPASPRQKKKLREQLRRLLCRRDVRVIGQNVKFDVTYLATHLDMLLRIGGDTLMLATLLDENMLQRNLDILTKHYVPEMAGYADCVHPSTLMLMEDLTKKPASAIRVGDRLVGFEEEADGGSSRKMVDTVVESVRTLRMVSLRVVMDSGECIQVSANHQFLRGPRNTGNGGSWVWRPASSLAVGDTLKLFPFPDEDRSYDAGWLSGILDGEGYATTHGPAGLRLGFSQKRGPVQERASRLFNGGDCQVSWDLRKDLANVTVTGARAMRELIRLRPIRLVGKKPWIGKSLFVGEGTHSRIRSIEYVGVQDVVSIQTTSHTFVAAGFATHNCFNASVDKSRMWTVPLRKMVPYGCGDADAAFRLYHALWKLVAEDDKLVRHYRYVSLPGLNTLASMEMRGLNVDDGALVAFEKLLAESVDRQYQELLAQVPRSIKRVHIDKGLSFSRGDFVRDILFSHKDGFRLKPKVFTKTTAKLPTHLRVPSTSSKDHLPYFFDECPFTMALSQYVKDERLLSTSVRGFKTKYIHDGMVRPTYSLTVTVTGRTSCVKGDTPINTLRGIVRADAVVEGDYVFTHRGRWRRVVELFRKAPTMMYSLYLSNGEVLTVTGAHRILLNSGEWRTVHSLLEIGEGNALTLQSTSEGSHTHSQGGEHLSHATTNDTGSGSTSRSQSPNGACNDRTLSIAGGVQSTQEYPIPQEQAGGEEPAVRARMGVRLRGWPGLPNSLSEGEEVLCASDSLCGLSGDSCGATAGESSSPSHRREPEEQHPGQPSGLYGRVAPEDTRTVPNAGGGLTIEKVICAGVHRVYDFEVDEDHSYLACGVFNHNSENPNGQNFPKRGNNAKAYRRSYVAPPGYVVLEADLSQAELRISADMAQDRVMLKVYNEGGDIHSTTAATTLNVPGAVFAQWGQDKRKLIDCANEIAGSGDFLRKLNPGQRKEATVKDYYKAKRQEAKAINFGFIYGMGWRKFVGYAKTQYGVEFTDAEAEAIRTAYFRKYSALTGWHERTRAYAKTHKQVRSYSGRIRHLPMIDSDDDAIQSEASRQAINSPVQEFGSSLGVMAMGRLHERMDDRYIAPIAFVHDAIYVLVPIEYAIWGAQTLKWYMQTNPIEKWFGIRMSCPIVADVSIGFNLGDTYEMEGLTVDEEYDYASLWDEEKQSGIKLPPQRIPPNNGTRSKPVYTYVD